jgi:hypothetical protein
MKTSKRPPLSSKTRLLSFDLESNGLHGKVFAVGAVVMGAYGQVLEQFSGRTEIDKPVDSWVTQNILPVITDMPITHKTPEELREAFWKWYLGAEPKSDYVLVNNGYPVEYRFLLQAQETDLDERYWQHPFPILDLSSLLILAGQDKNTIKQRINSKYAAQLSGSSHHPLYDAKIAALAAFEAFRVSGRI